jgi:hypothetical protein
MSAACLRRGAHLNVAVRDPRERLRITMPRSEFAFGHHQFQSVIPAELDRLSQYVPARWFGYELEKGRNALRING